MVQETNDSSIVSKLSTSKHGYFVDEFLPHFVSKKVRRSPLIHRGYHIRHLVMTHVYESFLELHGHEQNQIISFGAGFDTSYLTLNTARKIPNTKYIEVDFPDVVKRKRIIIEKNGLLSGSQCKESSVEYFTDNYKLLSADLCDFATVASSFGDAGVDYHLPTLFVSEVSITYMPSDKCTSLIKWCCDQFSNAVFTSYEQVNPRDAFGIVMMKHFNKLHSPLRSICKFPDVTTHTDRYKENGWEHVFIQDLNLFHDHHITLTEKQRLLTIEPFDEFEEWHLKCGHYILITSANGRCSDVVQKFQSTVCQCMKLHDQDHARISSQCCAASHIHSHPAFRLEDFTTINSEHNHVYGHTVTQCNEHDMLLFGGFGEFHGRHQRISNVFVFDAKNRLFDQCDLIYGGDGEKAVLNVGRMFHTATSLQNKLIIIIGGRTSPMHACQEVLCLKTEEVNPHRKCHVSEIRIKGDSPKPRWRHSAVHVNSENDGECIMIHGGRTVNSEILNDTWMLDTQTWMWTQFACTGIEPPGMFSHSAVATHSRMFITGGLLEFEQVNNAVYQLDIATQQWTQLSTEPTIARYSHDSLLLGNRMILFGGVNKNYPTQQPGIAVIDIDGDEIVTREYSLPVLVSEPYFFYGVKCVPYGDKVLLFGGGGNCFSFGTHFNACVKYLELEQFQQIEQ